jgi:hypothetical protein
MRALSRRRASWCSADCIVLGTGDRSENARTALLCAGLRHAALNLRPANSYL